MNFSQEMFVEAITENLDAGEAQGLEVDWKRLTLCHGILCLLPLFNFCLLSLIGQSYLPARGQENHSNAVYGFQLPGA